MEVFFTMNRVYNFSAGPATLPEKVLQQAADEMLCYGDSGQSVMEMSHRSKEYQAIIENHHSDPQCQFLITTKYFSFRAELPLNLL